MILKKKSEKTEFEGQTSQFSRVSSQFLNVISRNNYFKRLFGWYQPKFDFSKRIRDSRYIPTLTVNNTTQTELFTGKMIQNGVFSLIRNLHDCVFMEAIKFNG